MKTLAVWLLSLAVVSSAFAQTPSRQLYGDPGLQSIADYHAAAERDYAERTAGMLARPLFTSVELTNGIRYRVTLLGVKPEGIIIDASEGIRKRTQIVLKEALGLEDKVRFGFGSPDEVATVTKIKLQREKARLAAEQLELMRRQAEAQEAIASELYRQEQDRQARLIFGR